MQTQLQHSDHRRSDEADRGADSPPSSRRCSSTQLEQGGFQMVTTAAPDVLVLRPAIINLYIPAPQNMADPSEQTFSSTTRTVDVVPGALRFGDEPAARARDRSRKPQARTDGMFMWQTRAGNITGRRRSDDEVGRYPAPLHGGRAWARSSSASLSTRGTQRMRRSSSVVGMAAAVLLIVATSVFGDAPPTTQQLYVYPAHGQTYEQQQQDQFQCYEFGKNETGFDPMAAPPPPPPQPKRAGFFGGAFAGALLGVAVGAIAGNAGEGAAIGAASGGLFGGMRSAASSAINSSRVNNSRQQHARAQSEATTTVPIPPASKAAAIPSIRRINMKPVMILPLSRLPDCCAFVRCFWRNVGRAVRRQDQSRFAPCSSCSSATATPDAVPLAKTWPFRSAISTSTWASARSKSSTSTPI